MSDESGRFFLVARLPSGEPVRRQLGRCPIEVGPVEHARSRGLLARLHNPGGHTCACLPDCWCRHSWVGYAVRWYVPARWHRVPPPGRS